MRISRAGHRVIEIRRAWKRGQADNTYPDAWLNCYNTAVPPGWLRGERMPMRCL